MKLERRSVVDRGYSGWSNVSDVVGRTGGGPSGRGCGRGRH